MKRLVLRYAKAQLAGGVEFDEGTYECRCCRGVFYITQGLEPCAFCDSCTGTLLQMFAEELVEISKPQKKEETIMKKKTKKKTRTRTTKPPVETFPSAIFVVHDGIGDDQVMLVEENIDGISQSGTRVATYHLQSVQTLVVGKHLE
jgi:hypothetical protein